MNRIIIFFFKELQSDLNDIYETVLSRVSRYIDRVAKLPKFPIGITLLVSLWHLPIAYRFFALP